MWVLRPMVDLDRAFHPPPDCFFFFFYSAADPVPAERQVETTIAPSAHMIMRIAIAGPLYAPEGHTQQYYSGTQTDIVER